MIMPGNANMARPPAAKSVSAARLGCDSDIIAMTAATQPGMGKRIERWVALAPQSQTPQSVPAGCAECASPIRLGPGVGYRWMIPAKPGR